MTLTIFFSPRQNALSNLISYFLLEPSTDSMLPIHAGYEMELVKIHVFPAEKPLVFLNSGSVGTAIANEVSVILTSLSILFLDRWLGPTARGRLEDKGSRSLEVSTGHAHRQPAAPVPLCLRTVPTRRRADQILNRNWFRSSLCLLWITSRES